METPQEAIERRMTENGTLAAPVLTVGQWRSILFVINHYKAGNNRNNAWHLSVAENASGGIIDSIEDAIGHR